MTLVRKHTALTLFFLALLLPIVVLGQPNKAATQVQATSQLAQVYAERERAAPPAIKQQLTQLRAEAAQKNFKFQIGYTSALDKNLATLAGTRAPANLPAMAEKQNAEASKLLQVDEEAKQAYLRLDPNALPEFKETAVQRKQDGIGANRAK